MSVKLRLDKCRIDDLIALLVEALGEHRLNTPSNHVIYLTSFSCIKGFNISLFELLFPLASGFSFSLLCWSSLVTAALILALFDYVSSLLNLATNLAPLGNDDVLIS